MKNRIIALVIVLVLALMPMAQASTYDVASLTVENPTISMYGEEVTYPVSAALKLGMDEETGAYVGNIAGEFNGAPINAALAFDGNALYANVDGMQNVITVSMASLMQLFQSAMAEQGVAFDEETINALIEMATPLLNALSAAEAAFSDPEKTEALMAAVTEMTAGWVTTYEQTIDFNTEITQVPVSTTRIEVTLEQLMQVVSVLTTSDAEIAAAIGNVLVEAENLLVSLSGDESMAGLAQQIMAILSQPEAFAEMEIRFIEEVSQNEEVGVYVEAALAEGEALVTSDACQLVYTETGFEGYFFMNMPADDTALEFDFWMEALEDNTIDFYGFLNVNDVNTNYIDVKTQTLEDESSVSVYVTDELNKTDCYVVLISGNDGSFDLYINNETYDDEDNSISCDEYDITFGATEEGNVIEIFNESKGVIDFGDGDVYPYDDVNQIDITFAPQAGEAGISIPALIEYISYSVPEEGAELTDADVLYASVPVTVELYTAEDALYLPAGELVDILTAMNDEEAMNALSADLMQAIAPFLSATGLMGSEG